MTCRWKKQRSISMNCALLWEWLERILSKIGKEGVKKMQKTKDFCVDENGWVHCPFCKCRTRTKIRADTSLKEFSNILSQMQTGMFDRC